ncbi:hypothetical protein LJB42_000952 [Komagataella kurtzmanii]|nr:hypothetical protein LJB42_000952 [Komagataella kurtzmanii]
MSFRIVWLVILWAMVSAELPNDDDGDVPSQILESDSLDVAVQKLRQIYWQQVGNNNASLMNVFSTIDTEQLEVLEPGNELYGQLNEKFHLDEYFEKHNDPVPIWKEGLPDLGDWESENENDGREDDEVSASGLELPTSETLDFVFRNVMKYGSMILMPNGEVEILDPEQLSPESYAGDIIRRDKDHFAKICRYKRISDFDLKSVQEILQVYPFFCETHIRSLMGWGYTTATYKYRMYDRAGRQSNADLKQLKKKIIQDYPDVIYPPSLKVNKRLRNYCSSNSSWPYTTAQLELSHVVAKLRERSFYYNTCQGLPSFQDKEMSKEKVAIFARDGKISCLHGKTSQDICPRNNTNTHVNVPECLEQRGLDWTVSEDYFRANPPRHLTHRIPSKSYYQATRNLL